MLYGIFAMDDGALERAAARAFDLNAACTLLRIAEEKARRRVLRTTGKPQEFDHAHAA